MYINGIMFSNNKIIIKLRFLIPTPLLRYLKNFLNVKLNLEMELKISKIVVLQ